MLHIVQVVFAGRAETPRVFLHQAEAEAVFVAHVKSNWRQSYATFCEQGSVDADSFSSAKAFLETLDLAEKSTLNYWIVTPEGADLDLLKDAQGHRRRQASLGKLIKQAEQRSAALKDGLNGLLEDLAELGETVGEPTQGTAEGADPTPAKAEEAAAAAEEWKKEAIEEWQTYARQLVSQAGGRNEFPLLPRADWRQEVYSSLTSLEYLDWVAAKIEQYRDEAAQAGYTVIETPVSSGDYKFKTPQGALSEKSYSSEGEAWCRARMQLTRESAGEGK